MLEKISEHRSFDGVVGFYKHASSVNNCDMKFSVFVPPQAAKGNVPVLTFLSGLTCTEETFMIKSGAQRIAAQLGLMLVTPDTSPRGEGVPDDAQGAYDFGLGAGFYLNAARNPGAGITTCTTTSLPRCPTSCLQIFRQTEPARVSSDIRWAGTVH
jgi:S-formylglutathione hydrolase